VSIVWTSCNIVEVLAVAFVWFCKCLKVACKIVAWVGGLSSSLPWNLVLNIVTSFCKFSFTRAFVFLSTQATNLIIDGSWGHK
jgi:hypothetical protein